VQIPLGAVRREPIKQELSAYEVAAVRRFAASEERGRGEDDDDDDDDDGESQDSNELLADPAFNSIRDVELPGGMHLGHAAGKHGKKPSKIEAAAAAELAQREAAVKARGVEAPAEFDDDDDDDEDEDADDLIARPNDCFLLVANTEDEFSSLEVHCYNEDEGALYVHHDITLPAFPLCVAWMDYAGDAAASLAAAQPSTRGGAAGVGSVAAGAPSFHVGSYVAVGTFKPDIEIWNADVLDPLEPALTLHGAALGVSGGKAAAAEEPLSAAVSSRGGRVGKKPRSVAAVAAGGSAAAAASAPSSSGVGHSDAVMGLSWNRVHRHMLASSSADRTVKVWDLDAGGRVLHTYEHHKGKVQSVAWNPAESSVLATASFDRTLAVTDARAADRTRIARYALPGDPESLQWNLHSPAALIASCEDGTVLSYDCRMPDKALWTLRAHGASATCVSLSALARGLMATSSLDKSVRLWDIGTAAGGPSGSSAPLHVATKTMSIGQVFSCAFFPHKPFLLAAGGSKGVLAIWDIATDGGELTSAASGSGSGVAVGASSSGEADFSFSARRFSGRIARPEDIPSLAVRPRPDGHLVASAP
jgi:periodic tryptophan protein 1